jgi:hypothetical protein
MVMEAALLNSCQILVEGKYSGLMEPWENYIPIKADVSNWDDVHLAMEDYSLIKKIINNTRVKILDVKELRAEVKARQIVSDISALHNNKNISSCSQLVRDAMNKYRLEMSQGAYRKIWIKNRLRKRLVASLENYPRIRGFAKKMYNKVR